MKNVFFLFFFITFNSFSQGSVKDVLKKYNKESVPYISSNELNSFSKNIIVLDARERKEFDVSHIKNAIFVGYDNFNLQNTLENLTHKNKDTKIVVYCTLGVRSEDIAEKLKKAGFMNTYNLFGGIIEWKNSGYKVYDINNSETNKVHVFSKKWSQWLTKGTKVYE